MLLHRARRFGVEGGIEKGRAQAQFAQRGHLVLHQCDQWRDDDAQTLAQQRRDLEAQRLAAAGGHQHQGIAARGDVLDGLALQAAERRVAPDVLQEVFGGGRRVRGCRHRDTGTKGRWEGGCVADRTQTAIVPDRTAARWPGNALR